jgi:hypothetical protein
MPTVLNGQLFLPGPVLLGGPTGYTEFEADGTMLAVGNATCFRDELQSLAAARLESPSSDIVLNIAEASVTFEATARYPADYAITNHQLNHDWLPGSVIDPHLHWWQPDADTVNWMVGYRWQKQGSAKTTPWTDMAATSDIFTYSSGTLNQITEFGPITPPVGYGDVSDVVQFRIYRDVTNVSTLFAGAEASPIDVDATNFDTHIEVNMLGSRQEYAK